MLRECHGSLQALRRSPVGLPSVVRRLTSRRAMEASRSGPCHPGRDIGQSKPRGRSSRCAYTAPVVGGLGPSVWLRALGRILRSVPFPYGLHVSGHHGAPLACRRGRLTPGKKSSASARCRGPAPSAAGLLASADLPRLTSLCSSQFIQVSLSDSRSSQARWTTSSCLFVGGS